MKTLSLAVLSAIAGLTIGTPSHAQSASGIDVLLQQAEFWHSRNRDELAAQTLQRALQVQPDSEEAMYRMGLYALPDDPKTAEGWLQRLRQLNPDSPYIQSLSGELASQGLDRSRLPEIRALASRGESAQAAQAYRNLFNGAPPPSDLALEYYQTLAGEPAHIQEARRGLRALMAERPNDLDVRLALGRVLTYQEETRREGVELLAPLAARIPQAQATWRQALLWLDVKPSDSVLFSDYAQAYPGDTEVAHHFQRATQAPQENPGDKARVSGYAALEANQGAKAVAAFSAALKADPADADAWAGLGIAQLRAQRYQAARESLSKALELDPQRRSDLSEALGTAQFFEKLRAAEKARDQGRLAEAEQGVRPLTSGSGDRARAAKLLLADIEMRQQKPAEAERAYRKILAENLADADVAAGLYGAFLRQGKRGEAADLLRRYPALAQRGIGNVQEVEALSLRDKAVEQRQGGDAEGAAQSLAEALSLAPENPWIRLEYARLLVVNNDPRQARLMIEPAEHGPVNSEALQAAAIFASEQGRWDDAGRFLKRMPAEVKTTPELKSLQTRIELNERLNAARRAVSSGNTVVARRALRSLYDNAPDDFASRGSVAQTLAELGEPGLALTMVRNDLAQNGSSRPVGEYLSYVAVLGRTGQVAEADALMRTLERRNDLSADDAVELQSLRNGFAVTQADRLREAGDLAGAYDTLMAGLTVNPSDKDLLLAMGRLYNSGKMYKEAGTVFDSVLRDAPSDADAVRGGVNAALSTNNVDRATKIISRAGPALDETTSLVMSAHVAAARGDNRRAIALLESAQRKQGERYASTSNAPVVPPAGLASANPFREGGASLAYSGTQALPATWRSEQAGDGQQANPFSSLFASNPTQGQPVDPVADEISSTLGALREKTSSYLLAGTQFRVRDGEAGLSQLTELNAPTRLSMVPLDSGRLEITATPTYIDGGTASRESANRFGGFAVPGAAVNTLFSYFNNQVGTDYATRLQALQQSQPTTALTQAQRTALLAQSRQSIAESVRDVAVAAGADTAEASAIYESLLTSSADRLLEGYRPGAQNDSGVALNLGFVSDLFSADIGTTPLGFTRTNVVGGAKWTPKVGSNGQISLGVDRRAVTDSVLSYAGAKDPYTGKTWGGVTKTGANFQYAYDSGDVGFYVGNDFYLYRGKEVSNNRSIGFNTGAYIRPIRDKHQELQTGINLGWMSFDKNLGGHTLGHGGYFSPENYVGLSFPVQYSFTGDRWDLKLKAAVGYQSFTQDSASYYPKDKALQDQLDQLQAASTALFQGTGATGPAINTRYESTSDSGMAFNGGASLEYKVGKQTRLGGAIGYDSFGDYSETSGSIYLKHSMEALP
jgi:tetratricopeptide (TPR) repeat protein